MKRILCLVLTLCMILTVIPFSVCAEEEKPQPNTNAYPDFADLNYGALYAHATAGGDSSQTWQRWHKDIMGVNSEDGVRYFFLPLSADDNYIEIYNNYGDGAATIGDVTIESYTSAVINYIEGEKITATLCKGTSSERDYTFVVHKSDAEAAVYVNDTTNSYTDYEGTVQNTDLWSFLVQNKENSVSDAKCSIIDSNGVQDTTLKKIKGRGNTNWKETDKKPFNLTFYDKTTIGTTTDKKFSFVSNAKDSTLLRNSIMYDLAYEVGSPYAPDQSFVDFFVNGVYRGSYIACQKIDLGKNSVVSLKDNSEDMDTGFNFLVEVDVWNYKSDVYFVSEKGYHVVLKTPDLDDYDETDPSMKAKYDYIKETYQKLEDALYNGSLSDIEAICDLDSLASQYLLQEFGKNCDGGYTSTFFTYNADEGKFYAAPLWDCDSDLGAVDCVRDGCSTSTIDHTGWITRIAKYEGTVNPLGQAFYVDGVSSEGKTFEEICTEMWSKKFIPAIDIILGNTEGIKRLKSIDNYASSIEKSSYINYIMWDFMWLCGDKNSSLNTDYTDDYEGEIKYLKDWTSERANWMSYMFGTVSDDSESRVVYFSTDLEWNDVHYYVWGDGYVPMKWPGEPAESSATDSATGNNIYKVTLPADVTKIIFNNGTGGEQTVDITLSYNKNYYVTSDSTDRINEDGQLIYNIEESVYKTETQPSTSITEATEATEDSVPITETVTTTSNTEPTETTVPALTSENTEALPTEIPTDKPETSVIATDNTLESVNTTESATAPETSAPAGNELLGDINLDSKVNIKDVTVLQKYLAKLVPLSENSLKVADTNLDGRTTIADATTIQKKIAGLINWN